MASLKERIALAEEIVKECPNVENASKLAKTTVTLAKTMFWIIKQLQEIIEIKTRILHNDKMILKARQD